MYRFRTLIGSLRVKLILIVLAVLIPTNIFLIITTKKIIESVWQKLLLSYESELEIYMVQMDDGFARVQQSLKELMGENWPDLSPTSGQYEFARINVWQTLKEERKELDVPQAAYLKTNWDNWVGVTRDLNATTMAEESALKRYLTEQDMEAYQPYSFELIEVEGTRYLINTVNYNEYSFGYIIKVSELLKDLYDKQTIDGEGFYLADMGGVARTADTAFRVDFKEPKQRLTVGDRDEDYQVIHTSSGILKYKLVRVIPSSALRAEVPQMSRIFLLFCGISLLLIPIMIFAVRRLVLQPMKVLGGGMHELEKENIDYRIPPDHSSTEFQYLNRSFNRMAEQIQVLRIESYEKDIEKLKMEAANLRLQINPHLLLNSLNMIYSLAQSKNHPLILRYTSHLMEYFRYSLRQNDELVPLDAEMRFVKNFINIQKIRFPEAFTSVYEIEEGLDEALVPPLIIENFVENSIKYALKMGETIEIMITAAARDGYMNLAVVDTGNGIPEEILEKLQRGEPIVNRTGKHIGIMNCRRRLKVFYGEQSEMKIMSADHSGTQVWMRFPLKYAKDSRAKESSL